MRQTQPPGCGGGLVKCRRFHVLVHAPAVRPGDGRPKGRAFGEGIAVNGGGAYAVADGTLAFRGVTVEFRTIALQYGRQRTAQHRHADTQHDGIGVKALFRIEEIKGTGTEHGAWLRAVKDVLIRRVESEPVKVIIGGDHEVLRRTLVDINRFVGMVCVDGAVAKTRTVVVRNGCGEESVVFLGIADFGGGAVGVLQ